MKNTEYRCKNCGRLLFAGQVISAHLEIKCHSCKHMTYIGDNYNTLTRNQYAFIVEIHEKSPGVYIERIVSSTPSVTKALGYTQSEVLSYNLDAIAPLYAHGANNALWSRYDDKNPLPFAVDTIHKKKDGTYSKAHVTIHVLMKHDGVRTALCVCEVMETAHVTLHSDLSITSPTSTNAPLAALQINKRGICTYISNGFERELGHTPRSLLLTSLFDHLGGDDSKKIKQYILDTSQQQASFHIAALPLKTKDGIIKTYQACFVANYQDNGIYSGYHILLS